MEKRSPFPGMDPFLEAHWHDVHASLMVMARNQIATQLPEDLIVSIEQSITLGDDSEIKRGDVDVSTWGDTSFWEDDWNPAYENYQSSDDSVTLALPILQKDDDIPHRYLEIRSARSNRAVVTVIEVLSPSNKSGQSGLAYNAKRESYHRAKMNFVEIDLLRQGVSFADQPDRINTPYHLYVKRWSKPSEVYEIDYKDRLPQFLIPLRPKDQPATLNLQEAIDECYQNGQYWKRIDYQNDKLTPTPSDEMNDWIGTLV